MLSIALAAPLGPPEDNEPETTLLGKRQGELDTAGTFGVNVYTNPYGGGLYGASAGIMSPYGIGGYGGGYGLSGLGGVGGGYGLSGLSGFGGGLGGYS